MKNRLVESVYISQHSKIIEKLIAMMDLSDKDIEVSISYNTNKEHINLFQKNNKFNNKSLSVRVLNLLNTVVKNKFYKVKRIIFIVNMFNLKKVHTTSTSCK